MGIKALKKEFNIGHIVQRRDGKILIGSPYVSELIAINPEGEVSKSKIVQSGRYKIGQIYEALIACNKARLLKIINEPEIPIDPKPVFTEAGRGRVIKVYCEEYGYPNITTEGELMYENSHFQNRAESLKHAKENRAAEIKWVGRDILEKSGGTFRRIKQILFKLLCLARLYITRGH